MKNKKYVYGVIALAALITLAGTAPAFAETTTVNQPSTQFNGRGMMNRGNMMKRGVFGTVSAVNGNVITVTSKQGFNTNAVTTTFTIDATNAKVIKNNVAGTISSIIVGDTIIAQGTLTGTNLVATNIRDSVMARGNLSVNKNKSEQQFPTITGNGQPVVIGTISTISGSTITITNKSNVSYTIDATNAKITKGPNTVLISGVVVGDTVIVQGTVNGNAIVASSIIDQTKPVNTSTTVETTEQPHKGFFSGVGSFFAHLFGF